MEEFPSIPANDNFTPEQEDAFARYMEAMGKGFIAHQEVAALEAAFAGALAKVEATLARPLVGRESAIRLFNSAVEVFNRFVERHNALEDRLVGGSPTIDAFAARLRALREKIDVLP